MMPVVPTAKRLNGFSIDSLMSKDSASTASSNSSGAASVGSPPPEVPVSSRNSPIAASPGSSFHPVMAGSSFLGGLKSMYPGGTEHSAFPAELLGGLGHQGLPGLTHPALAAHGLPGLHPQHSLYPHPLHPVLLGAHRDPYPLYPWLMSRPGTFHRFAGTN